MSEETIVKQIEVMKITLEPGDVLISTIKSEYLDQHSMTSLGEQLRQMFPNNKVVVMGCEPEGDIKFVVAKDASLSDTKVGCGTTPNNFCSDCSCGKKEAYEQNKW
jgi:hypothetical protein